MDTQSARRALAALWALLYAARERELTDEENKEIQRLCHLLKQGVRGNQDFNAAAERLCLGIFASGVFENGKAANAEDLLEDVDDLGPLLNQTPSIDPPLAR